MRDRAARSLRSSLGSGSANGVGGHKHSALETQSANVAPRSSEIQSRPERLIVFVAVPSLPTVGSRSGRFEGPGWGYIHPLPTVPKFVPTSCIEALLTAAMDPTGEPFKSVETNSR